MKGTVTITDENRILIILGGDWRTPQQIMRCLKNAGPDVAQGATIHLTTTDGKDDPAISLELADGDLALQFKKTIQAVRSLKEAGIIQSAELS